MYFNSIINVAIDIDGSGNLDRLKNLTAKAKVSEGLLNNAGYYQTLEIQDGERPDHLSQRLYGTDQYHWTFLLLNPQIKNIWDDWPMKYSQLVEYCENKYQYLAADVSSTNDNDLNNKFIIGEPVVGSISEASGILKEVHVNLGYLVIERTSISSKVTTAGNFFTNSWYKIVTVGTTDYTLIGSAANTVGTVFKATAVGTGTGTAEGIPRTFTVTGETITGLNSQDSISCNFIKSQAYAPHHHIDDSTGDWVPRRLAGTTPYSYFDYESAVTEQNRNIKVIKPEHVSIVAQQFSAAMANA
jgi:hypothetical protein